MLTILDGSTFVISDDIGDVGLGAEGVFADDTRMLSRCRLLLDGESPLLLTSRAVDYFSATHYLRNAPTPRIPADTVSIGRERFVGSTVTEHLTLSNESMSELDAAVELELAADFTDIISVKAHDFAFGHPESAAALPAGRLCSSVDDATFAIEDDEGYRTTIRFSQAPELTPAGARFSISPPGACQVGADLRRSLRHGRRMRSLSRATRPLAPSCSTCVRAWRRGSCGCRASRRRHSNFSTSTATDRGTRSWSKGIEGIGELPAAGMPWFMTVFGRDTLITSLQTLVFGPELAIGALRSLAALQAVEDDPAIDAEPGKILAELPGEGEGGGERCPICWAGRSVSAYPRAAVRGLAVKVTPRS